MEDYREWLLNLTICDPACGSGAFLNEALNFLIAEHRQIDEMKSALAGGSMVYQDVEHAILERNLYGVDINEESVEIAKLSLWLRTAQRGRKLNNLNNNIKCGNSLISAPEIAGRKAFSFQTAFPQVFEKGGFDVIIGNPPYVQVFDVLLKNTYSKLFVSFTRNNDLYTAFYERSISLIRENGLLGFITPNTFIKGQYFKELREYLVRNQIIEIIDFGNKLIFEDANVFSAITILSKQPAKNDWILKSGIETIKGTIKFGETVFLTEDLIINKLKKYSTIDDFFLVKDVGLNYWSVGRGKVKGNSIGDRILYRGEKLNLDDIPYIKGSNFNKYTIPQIENYLRHNYEQFLNENDVFRYSSDLLSIKPKLIYRQTSNSLISTIDENGYCTDKTTHIIVNRENFSENLYFLMTLFNSKLYQYIYAQLTEENGRAFAQVKTVNVKKLPYKQINAYEQKPFIELAERMIADNQALQKKAQAFTALLQRRFDNLKISGKLQTWYELDDKSFFAELKKSKIKLTLKEEMELAELFETMRGEAQAVARQIAATDQEIDKRVFELYDLSDEEIAIVQAV